MRFGGTPIADALAITLNGWAPASKCCRKHFLTNTVPRGFTTNRCIFCIFTTSCIFLQPLRLCECSQDEKTSSKDLVNELRQLQMASRSDVKEACLGHCWWQFVPPTPWLFVCPWGENRRQFAFDGRCCFRQPFCQAAQAATEELRTHTRTRWNT